MKKPETGAQTGGQTGATGGPQAGMRDWLSLANPPHWARSRWLGAAVGGCIVLLFVWVIAVVVGALVAMSGAVLFPSAAPMAAADLRGVAVFATAALGAPFIIWRTIVASRQNDLQAQALAQDKAAAARSLFNDKINAATVELAARRQVTTVDKDTPGVVLTEWQDDMLRRAAGIDRLEGLAKEQLARIRRPDSSIGAQGTPNMRSTDELTEDETEALDEALRIAKLLCTYVKELSVDHPAEKVPEGLSGVALRDWVRALQVKRRDAERAVQSLAAINAVVQGIFAEPPRVVNLASANLQKYDLAGLNLDNSDLRLAQMQGANLFRAQMQGADLPFAQMQGADLSVAQMQGAILNGAQMQGANLSRAQMQGAYLSGAQMQGARLSGAQMQGARLWGAQMQGARLWGAQMQGASFRGIWPLDPNDAPQVWRDHVATLFDDAGLKLPDEITRPDWPDLSLDDQEFQAEWDAWKALGPDGYVWADRRKYYTDDGKFTDLGPPPPTEGDWLEREIKKGKAELKAVFGEL